MDSRKSSHVKQRHTGRKIGPERGYFHSLKDRTVEIQKIAGGDSLIGKISWVDRYTICIQLEVNGKEVMVYKHAISTVYTL